MDTLTPGQPTRAFNSIDFHRATHPDARVRTNGPIDRIHRAAHAAGWHFINATSIATPHGVFNLVTQSPAALERVFRQHYSQVLEQKALTQQESSP